jgi:uncharacterized protein YndB with AHSA1/START domain
MSTTRMAVTLRAPRERVYRALLDPVEVQVWRVPEGMTSQVHVFEAREGGAFRVSLTYDEAGSAGKTSAHTDTYHGHFARLVPNEQVVEVLAFESDNPALRGEMRITVTLSDVEGGTRLEAVHEGVPDTVPPEDNELGWRMSLGKLAALVEGSR